MAVFEAALAYCLANEGTQYVNLAADHGGPTRYGITQKTLTSWRGQPATPADVEGLTVAEASAIYRERYWGPVCGDGIASTPVATAIFDAAVVCGPGVAIRLAQAVTRVAVDGHMGPITLAAVQNMQVRSFLLEYMDQMAAHFLRASHGPQQAIFLPGWWRRAARVASLIP